MAFRSLMKDDFRQKVWSYSDNSVVVTDIGSTHHIAECPSVTKKSVLLLIGLQISWENFLVQAGVSTAFVVLVGLSKWLCGHRLNSHIWRTGDGWFSRVSARTNGSHSTWPLIILQHEVFPIPVEGFRESTPTQGLLRSRLRIDALSLLPHSLGQIKSKAHPRLNGLGNSSTSWCHKVHE